MIDYYNYLKGKTINCQRTGFEIPPDDLNPALFDWQREVTAWSIKCGSAALFEECGLGKTPQQLVYSDKVAQYTGKPVLILAPLAVSMQTVREGFKFGVAVNIAENNADIRPGVNVTNYEKLDKFDAKVFGGIVLDESSILKSYMGKTKRMICERFSDTPFKLACTATPAPNDLMELLNHAEFLGIMKSSEALSIWFIADQRQSGKYKLKGHAKKDFWRWVSSWAVCIEKPSDIGYSDDGYILPKLTERDEMVSVGSTDNNPFGDMGREINMSATGFYKEKSRTALARAIRTADIVTSDDRQYMVWCDTNEEADILKRIIPQAAEVRGNDSINDKERAAIGFVEGDIRVLISKPSIFGFGLNFQNCHNTVFCGLNYSFEGYYQAVRRFHRFGQANPVTVWRVLGLTEKTILDTINRKAADKKDMAASMAENMALFQKANIQRKEFTLDLTSQKINIPIWLRSEPA